ncbi:MAG: CsbD family protein [Burkholderiales bacterium]
MNKDQVTGAAKDIGGKVQEKVGELIGNSHQQAEGLKLQIKGNLQETVGDLKQTVKEMKDTRQRLFDADSEKKPG